MPRSFASSIASTLRQRIIEGRPAAGELLADERTLAAEFGVARNTVRSALQVLEAEGLIERHVGRGTFVCERPDGVLGGIRDRFLNASPFDILTLRLYIEPQIAARAAVSVSDVQLAEIQRTAHLCAAAADLKEFVFRDNEFHRAIYTAAGNQFLTDFFSMLAILRHQTPMMEIRRNALDADRLDVLNGQHAKIVTALRAWDGPAVATAMTEHLMTSRQYYFSI